MGALWYCRAADGAISPTGIGLPTLSRTAQRRQLCARGHGQRKAFRDRRLRTRFAQPRQPDVRDCYSKEEVILAESDEVLEAAAEEVLRDPTAALAMGEKARRRTAREHLWEHRLEKALA